MSEKCAVWLYNIHWQIILNSSQLALASLPSRMRVHFDRPAADGECICNDDNADDAAIYGHYTDYSVHPHMTRAQCDAMNTIQSALTFVRRSKNTRISLTQFPLSSPATAQFRCVTLTTPRRSCTNSIRCNFDKARSFILQQRPVARFDRLSVRRRCETALANLYALLYVLAR